MRQLFFLFAFTVISSFAACGQELPFKVAYADTKYILSKMPDLEELNERLRSTQAKLQSDYESKQALFKKQYDEYTANVQTMPDTVRANAERELQLLNNEIQQFPEEAKSTIDKTRMLWMAPIYLKIGRAIELVAIENGYSIILPKGVGERELLLYTDTSRNVSDLVLVKLGVTTVPEEKK